MSVDTTLPLSTLAEWVRATDRRAALRLPLCEQAERILAAHEPAADDQRRHLAERLERWRYEHLDEHRGRLAPEDRRLADALDLAANELAGRDPRPPRWPRAAAANTSGDREPAARAAACLDPAVPLEELADRAAACLDPAVPLEDLADRAAGLTREHFAGTHTGRRRMLLYAPLYLSSHCINHCVYCGFRRPHDIRRRHLSVDEALRQAEILRNRGFRHVLLVAGDYPGLTTVEYYARIIRALAARGICPAIEIAPQTTASYAELAAAGACGITLYQETYNEPLYALYHPPGSKTSYDWRLEGVERAAEAGIGRLGLGVLLGLADPREDLLAMIRHAAYLHARFPERTLAFSLPRIYEAPQGFQPPYPVDDQTFVRLYCSLRVAVPRAELVLSTREPAGLRSRLAKICVTQLSAGSSTVPGGYEDGADQSSGQQFPVSDHRPPAEVARWLKDAGFEVVWEVPWR